jgi:hypothetical protein
MSFNHSFKFLAKLSKDMELCKIILIFCKGRIFRSPRNPLVFLQAWKIKFPNGTSFEILRKLWLRHYR